MKKIIVSAFLCIIVLIACSEETINQQKINQPEQTEHTNQQYRAKEAYSKVIIDKPVDKDTEKNKFKFNNIPITWKFEYKKLQNYPFLFIEYNDPDYNMNNPSFYDRVLLLQATKTILDDTSHFMDDCSAQPPDEIVEHCSTPLQIKKAGLDNKEVYVIIQKGASFHADDEIFNKTIEEIQKLDSVKIFNSFVPPIDEKGFVSIQYVDKVWCEAYANWNYPNQCEDFINRMKNANCSPEIYNNKFSNVCSYFNDIAKGFIAYR